MFEASGGLDHLEVSGSGFRVQGSGTQSKPMLEKKVQGLGKYGDECDVLRENLAGRAPIKPVKKRKLWGFAVWRLGVG